MKRIVVLFLLFMSCFSVGFQAFKQQPQSLALEVPELIKLKYDAEISKFKQYPLNDPQKMSEFLQRKLKKGNDLLAYLQALQRFASKLAIQQSMMQHGAYESYVTSAFTKLALEYEKWMIESGNEIKPCEFECSAINFSLYPQTDEQTNLIIAHGSILSKTDFDLNERKLIYSWILDESKGAWLNNFGKSLKNVINEGLINKELSEYVEFYDDFHHPACYLSEFSEELPFIKENISFLFLICDIMQNFAARKETMKKGQYLVTTLGFKRESEKKRENAVLLYESVAQWYMKLYKALREEMKMTIRELIKQNTGNNAFIKSLSRFKTVNPLFENQEKNEKIVKSINLLRDEKLIPPELPDELPDWIKPSNKISIPSYDKEFEEFKVEWEKTHPAQPPTVQAIPKKPVRKKIRRRRPTTYVPLEIVPAALPSEPEVEEEVVETEQALAIPAKLKEGADGSYINVGDDTDVNIIIHNPKNNTIEILYKSDPEELKKQILKKEEFLKKHFPPHYTSWVKMWAENPNKALTEQGYRNPKNKKFKNPEEHPQVIAYHDFSVLVDSFIPQWSVIASIPSRRVENKEDILITIPGKMILERYPKNYPEREATGLYTYVIDSENGQWYHRMFEPKSGKQLVRELLEQGYYSPEMTGIYEVHFPGLPSKQK